MKSNKLFGGILFLALATVLGIGCAKDKLAGDNTVVAEIGDQKVTTADWVSHMDLYRVVQPGAGIDPTDPDHVKQVLDSLLDQDVVLAAAAKEKFASADLDKELNKSLPDSETKLVELQTRLERDLAAVKHVRKNFKVDYTKMLTAQAYAQTKVKDVIVTEKEVKDRFDEYVSEAKSAGEKPQPYEKVRDQVRLRAMADKLLTQLRAEYKVSRHEDAIQKYLAQISPSQQILKKDK